MAKLRFPSKIIPPAFERVFERPRLFEMLSANQHRPLVWVNGAAGSGKTALVCSWLKQQHARFLWYRMDKGRNISADLFYFLALCAQRNYPRKHFKLPIFTAECASDIKAFSEVFFRQLFTVLEKETAIVFDDCQEMENAPDFFQVLQIAIQELPEGLQMICLSRNRPDALFKRLSLTNRFLDIDTQSLRFTDKESSAFINWLKPGVDTQVCSNMKLKASGWAAALVLLVEQNQLTGVSHDMPTILEQQDIFKVLMAEILANMDEETIQFLVKTSVFGHFTVSMASTLTGNQSAGNILDNLLRKNLLIDRTGGTEAVYRYHPILRDELQNKLNKLFASQQQIELQRHAIKILTQQKNIEEALPIYVQLQDWNGLKPLLLEYSEVLIDTGRHSAVIAWIEQLPDEMLSNDPWLLFWYAAAIKPLNPNHCVELLDTCYQQFLPINDKLGLYSSWQLAVEAIFISMDDNTRLEIWFQRFELLRENHPDCPSIELNIKFSVTAIQALAFYNPQHLWLKKLLKISEQGFRIIPIKSLQHLLSSQIGFYYLAIYEICKLQAVKPYLLSAIEDEKLASFPRSMNAFLVGYLNLYQGNGDEGLNYLVKALSIQQQAAIPLFKNAFTLHKVACHICRGDLASAESLLDKVFIAVSCEQRVLLSLFHFYTAWISTLKGQLTLALEQNEHALLMSQCIKNDVGTVIILGVKVTLLAKMQRWDAAEKNCLLLAGFAKHSPQNKHYQLEYHLTSAWLGYLMNDRKRALQEIERFLRVVSEEQIRFFLGWQPDVIAPLCLLAIEHGIKVDFAVSMMQLNRLCPAPPKYLEQWPWPVRIYCFNQVRIELNGQLLKQKGKSQKKVIELLLIVIALGSQNVKEEKVCACLWPGSDGDLAQQALETALFRLRKLIGKAAIVVKDGRISINDECCWVDTLAFETTLKAVDDELQYETNKDLLDILSTRMLHLYQGSFLPHMDSPVVKLKQKQLQDKMTQLIERLINNYEKQQDHQRIHSLLEQCRQRIPAYES